LSSLSIISKGTNNLGSILQKEKSTRLEQDKWLKENFVSGVDLPTGTKSYMQPHSSFNFQRAHLNMGEKNKSFGNQSN